MIGKTHCFFIMTCLLLSWRLEPPERVKINDYLQSNWLEYDLGDIPSGKMRECELLLKNISSKTIVIDTLIPSCDCIDLYISDKRIRPSKTTSIRIRYNSSIYNHGYMEQSIILLIQNKKRPILFFIKANIKPSLSNL